jgi:hypothetical protein
MRLTQAQDAEAGVERPLGMGAGVQQALDEAQGMGTDRAGPGQDPLGCPVEVLAMGLGQVVRDGGVAAPPVAAAVASDPLSLVRASRPDGKTFLVALTCQSLLGML